MTILSALVRLYDRMEAEGKAPKPGFSYEKISFSLAINAEGRPLRLSDRRSLTDKKPTPVPMLVPAAEKRTVDIRSNRFWDKTSYVLGVTAVEKPDASGNKCIVTGQGKRTAREHKAFVDAHLELLQETEDSGLCALKLFLESWTPDQFEALGWPIDALDKNIVFQFDEGSSPEFLHNRPAVASLIANTPDTSVKSLCLVTGKMEPMARLHPPIKGVMGSQSSGTSLVSYNKDAYESFGKSQGANAPTSKNAAFAYVTALNTLLERKPTQGQEQHLRVGDTTVVFWAEAAEAKTANVHELLMGQALNPPDDDSETNRLRAALSDIAQGRATGPRRYRDTKVYMLGLAPNAARLSVRFWYPGSFGDFADNILEFWEDLRLEPEAWKGPPAVWSLLYETAVRAGTKPKAETIPPLLGGEVMRAVLNGKPLPRTLLSAIIRRVRADGDVSGRRAAICKAVINRTLAKKFSNHTHSEKEVIPVSLDPDNLNPAYRLGRLFAVLERTQSAALGKKLSATIKDRYFAAASATPARIFPLLIKNATHHLARLKKGENSKQGHWLEKEMGKIWLGLDANMPRTLALEDQGRFIAGYYHQRYTKADKTNKEADEAQVTETIK